MTDSLNGWPGITSGNSLSLRRIQIPGTTRVLLIARPAARVFAAFCADWHAEMPERLKLDKGPVDSWEYRDARTTPRLSNHASGTAIDLRYDVLLADRKRHMTPAETAIVHRILDRYVDDDGRRLFGWGGDWSAGFTDEMHTELAQGWAIGAQGRNTTLDDVKAVTKRLNIRRDGTRRGGPA
jgi:hypothetical protein